MKRARAAAWLTVVAAISFLMAMPALAAASEATSAYFTPGTEIESEVNQVSQVTQQSAATLPFTGLDVVVIVGVAMVLLALGLLLRHLARTDSLT